MPILGSIASSGHVAPNAPTIGTATDVGTGRAYNNGAATVTFTAPSATKFPITGYTVTSSPGGFTGTGASSPITVTGLQSGVSYTFTVTATNAIGTSAASSASNSITATTVPQAPTIGTASIASSTSVSVAFTAGATGGAAVSTYTATGSPSGSGTNSASPITVTGLTTGTAYTFTVTATNANGTSTASAASNSVTPNYTLSAFSASTAYPTTNQAEGVGVGGASGIGEFWAGVGIISGSASAIGYSWNGSGWTQKNFGATRYFPGMARISNVEYFGLGGYNFGSGTYGNVSYIFNGSWVAGYPNYPTGTLGCAIAYVGNGVVVTNGEASANSSYYSTGGSWTSRSTPFSTNTAQGTTDPTNSFGYYMFNNLAATYKLTGITGSWTATTNRPEGTANASPIMNLGTLNNQVTFYYSNASGVTNFYFYNGTAYTSVTAIPNGNQKWTMGGVGNTLNILQFSGTYLHYTATLT